MIRVDDDVHETLAAAVLFLRTRGLAGMRLLDGTNEAIRAWALWVQNTYNGGRPLPPVSAYDGAELRRLQVGARGATDDVTADAG